MTATLERAALLGREEPRLWTRPLRELVPARGRRPATSLGFEVIAFSERILGRTLLGWQAWWLIHALELKPDATLRFRTLLTLISRQNGKTELLKIVALWALFSGRSRLVLGAAQNLAIAKESWAGALELAEAAPALRAEIANVRHVNGEQGFTLADGARYKITAATRSAGRGLSVDLLILDELREHRDDAAWAALSATTMARPGALIVGISNAGDSESVVLNALRAGALAGGDESVGIFEWSAPDGCELDDPEAWASANPGLGRTVSEQALRTALATCSPAVFRTEHLCQRVDALDAAVDPASWAACADPSGSLAGVLNRVVAVVDVAPDGGHVALAGAALLDDGRVRVEILRAWSSTDAARRELPPLLARNRPAVVGWFPSGPAAALAPDLRAIEAVELRGADVMQACMGLAEQAAARRLLHPSDPLLDAHVAGAQKLASGGGWVFSRRGAGHVNAAYAAAGAVHLVRVTVPPPPKPKPRMF